MSATIISTAATSVSLTAVASGWWLKDPLDPTANLPVNCTKPPVHVKAEQMGVHYPLGRTRPVVTTDVMTGQDGQLTFLTIGPAAYTALEALKSRQSTLLLQSPFGEQWYVRLMDGRKQTLSPSVAAAAYRETQFDYIEVDVP